MKIIFHLFVLFFVLSCSAKNPSPEAQTGQPASSPASATATDSIPFPVYLTFDEFEPHLQASGDTTYVINFWATWCRPCIAEMPYFEKLIKAYEGKPVKVLLVSMDFPKDIQRKLVPFVAERNLAPHVAALADMDYNEWIDKVSTEWDGAIPFTLVYNQKGRTVKLGEMDGYAELEGMVKRAMK